MPRNNNALRQEKFNNFDIIFLWFERVQYDMTVYADISFFINFLFDAEILILLCKIYSHKIPKIKLILAALMGGLLGVFVFVPYLEILSRPPMRCIIPLFMVYIVFRPTNFKELFDKYASFLSISFLMSGMVFFMELGVLLGLLIPGVIYFLICILRKNITKKKGEVVLEYEGKQVQALGFFDSGNMLLSGGMPVILGNSKVFEKLLGCQVSDNNIFSLSERFSMRVIPFVSLGKVGTVLGIKLNRMWVEGKEYNDVILAYAGNQFSDDLILNSIMT